ncbi:MAG: tyrosine-type recombinase/integrase [Chloroflexi bacterium]|nr:tyrosine-type recombinase/integrase [Chloroflexota bacterium]
MDNKQVPGSRLFAELRDYTGANLDLRSAAKEFKNSMEAPGRYSPRYIESLEFSVGLLCSYAEDQEWPAVGDITTSHLEDYFVFLRHRPRWFGERAAGGPPVSDSHIETQYRRLRRFFRWLVERGRIDTNPLWLIPHPSMEEKVIETVPEASVLEMLRWFDTTDAETPGKRFRVIRDRLALLILWDTPGRRKEITALTLDCLDLDVGAVLVLGKGRKQRWMPLDKVVIDHLADYLAARRDRAAGGETALWVSEQGKPMGPAWIYRMLRRLGERCGVPNLHTHRFRHSYAMNALRTEMPEQFLRVIGGWKKIPETYFRTQSAEDAVNMHRQRSPAGRLARKASTDRRRSPGGEKPRSKL